MDHHLLALLLICICGEGLTNDDITDDAVPLVPLIPLMPSLPIETSTNESPQQSPTVAPTQEPTLNATLMTETDGELSEEEQDEACLSLDRGPRSREAIASAITKMGMQLLLNLDVTPEQPNVIISPLSISLALSQLALGAANETEELLMHYLHDNSLPCYHKTLHNVLSQLKNSDLQIATRIFLRQGFDPKPEFVHESKQQYNSEPVTLQGLQQINEWVEKATAGKITDFLLSLPPNLLLVLINAVHFKGEWKARFDPRFTSRGVFYTDSKNRVEVEMMEDAKHPLNLISDHELEAQVARFPFQKKMSLLVVLPHSGPLNMTTISGKLNISRLYGRLTQERVVQVKVPKFKLEYTQELQGVLTKLGLGEVFTRPNLAKIADGLLLVSSVMHKSSFQINEEGAEAAAVTSVVISRASNPIFYLNQPFFLALVDDMTHIPIFMGVITNPNPGAHILQKERGNKDKAGFPIDNIYDYGFGSPPK